MTKDELKAHVQGHTPVWLLRCGVLRKAVVAYIHAGWDWADARLLDQAGALTKTTATVPCTALYETEQLAKIGLLEGAEASVAKAEKALANAQRRLATLQKKFAAQAAKGEKHD